MNKRINFEDNIFALNLRIRMIRDLLVLDTDAGLFLEKTLEDLEFIGGSLDVLLKSLEENIRFIDREGQFENLAETERRFSRLLEEFPDNSGSLSPAGPPRLREKIDLLREGSGERQKLIGCSEFSGETASAEPVVSGAELSELLKALE